MKFEVCSCARAQLFRKKTVEETWSWIMEMLQGSYTTSFIPGGYPVEKIDESSSFLGVGGMFKYYTRNDGPYYLKITDYEVHQCIQYTTKLEPVDGRSKSFMESIGQNIMRFTLDSHPEGSVLTIERLEIGNLGLFRFLLGKLGLGFNKNASVSRLVYIISGSFPYNTRVYKSDSLYVERSDSLIAKLRGQ